MFKSVFSNIAPGHALLDLYYSMKVIIPHYQNHSIFIQQHWLAGCCLFPLPATKLLNDWRQTHWLFLQYSLCIQDAFWETSLDSNERFLADDLKRMSRRQSDERQRGRSCLLMCDEWENYFSNTLILLTLHLFLTQTHHDQMCNLNFNLTTKVSTFLHILNPAF